MKNKITIWTLSILTIFLLSFKIDETPLERLLKHLAKITANYPQEKAHLHLDKPYYAIGEDIWLKAYLVTAEKNEPSLLSNVLYVDLINSQNMLMKKVTLSVENGMAAGNINLIDSLTSGTYRIRAYTNYMRNYADDFYFEKFIKIGNILDPITATKIKEKKLDLSIKFFPEGGNLVAGIRNKVGVKAVTSDGLGANLSGYVLNRNKEKIAEFTTENMGMGVFALMPIAKENYTAYVLMTDGNLKSFNFPEIAESGYGLAINTVDENINVKISCSPDLVNGKEMFVVAQSNGVMYASFTSKIDNAVFTANIPKKSFPTGIVQFTLFNAESKPVSERLIFVNNNDALKIEVKNYTSAITTKKKMDLSLFVTDANNNSIDGNFSVSVTDAEKVLVNEDEEITIMSNLLLTADLKGFIEKPNYYFNLANQNRDKQLDNLLLTQGWRRFNWNDVNNQKEPEMTFRPEKSLEIAGKITSWGNRPLSNAKVIMFSNSSSYRFNLDTLSDIKGNFVFDKLAIPDTATFILHSKSSKNNPKINIIVNDRAPIIDHQYIGNSINMLPYLQSTKEMFFELNKFNKLDKGILLKPVIITGKRALKPLLNVPNSANRSAAADYVIKGDKLKYETNIYSVFTRVPGVMVVNNMIKQAAVRRSSMSITSQPPMLLIIDGVQINQRDFPGILQAMNPQDIAGIEVLTSLFNLSVYGSDGAWGIVYITTKTGGGPVTNVQTNLVKISSRGFTATKEFYSPDYDDPKTNQEMLDLRSTIYWKPNLNTDENGKATFNFFNASTRGTYRVTVEGMDTYGNIGRKVYTYQVKQNL
ncbi:hypothetical protein EZ428_01115 [Pedobacter frigiditerrae]|uniref:TonB-dependent receptor plug domain-containing protein n=1 Tax=Pedobacter frigiditerrae TaxID=2530452 RepID=A0A4R0N4E8_9SPHI|nr:TonB-dependent receptor plug domain-containing protein [Pedobacter frigiditerrae]TCC93402.1 hypothetical protein EZ428_01115 [Pedobacter frigiditerrae]